MAPQAESARVVGRYEVLDEIAAGGMATVHLGRVLGQGSEAASTTQKPRFVAIKRMHGQYGRDADFRSMFLDEARLCMRIQHPNVVPTLDVVESGGELLLVMELIDGESLSRLAKLTTARGERIPVPIVASVVSGMLRGLHAAHEAVSETGEPMLMVHRDVSPHNVIIGSDGIARVLDFGVAKARGRMQTTQQGQIKGKLAYMSPEQARGKEVDRRSDVFAAGIVLWELLLGKRLFEGENEASVLAQLLTEKPSTLATNDPKMAQYDPIVSRALHVEPTERFMTALELALVIERDMPVATPAEVAAWVRSEAGPALKKRADLIARHLAFSKRSDFDDTPRSEESSVDGPAPSSRALPGLSPPRMPKPTVRLPPPRPKSSRSPDSARAPAPQAPQVDDRDSAPPTAVVPAGAMPAEAIPPPPGFAAVAPPGASAPPAGLPPSARPSSPGGFPGLPRGEAEPQGLAYTMPLPPELEAQTRAQAITGDPMSSSQAHRMPLTPARWPTDFSDASGSFKAAAYGTTLLPAVTGPPPGSLLSGSYEAAQPGSPLIGAPMMGSPMLGPPMLGPPVPRPSDAPPAQSQVTKMALTTTDVPPPLARERVRQLTFVAGSTAAVVAIAFAALLVIVSKRPWDHAHSQRAAMGLTWWVSHARVASPKSSAAPEPPPPVPEASSAPSATPTTSASGAASAAPTWAPPTNGNGGASAPRPFPSSQPKPPSSGTKAGGAVPPTGSSKPKTDKPKR